MQRMLNRFVPDNADVGKAQVRTRIGTFAGAVGIVCNASLCIAKMLIGVLAGSVSIIADAVNNLSDAASNVISLIGFKLAAKPADRGHPYGHGRYEYLAGMLVAVLIIVVGIELLRDSIARVIDPEPVEFSWALAIVLALAIAVKLWMMVFNGRLGKLIDSKMLTATAADSRNDAITTAAVLAAAVISRFAGVELDGWMGALVAFFILWSGVGLVRETADPLLGSPPDPALVTRIEEKVLSHEGVLGIHDLMVHDYGPGRLFASVHVEVPAEEPVLKSHQIIDDIEERFRREDGIEVIIHLDPVVTTDPVAAGFRTWLSERVKAIDSRLTVHDVRMMPDGERSRVLFDCVRPFEYDMADDELRMQLEAAVREYDASYEVAVRIDIA